MLEGREENIMHYKHVVLSPAYTSKELTSRNDQNLLYLQPYWRLNNFHPHPQFMYLSPTIYIYKQTVKIV